MEIEWWKSFFELGGVVLLFLTFAFGAGVLLTGNKVNERQTERLRLFDSDLTSAQLKLAKQQERAAKAEGSIALAEQHASEANTKAEGFRLDIAKADKSARLAEARAAEANLALATFKAPRSLSLAQKAAIGNQLRPFGMKRVDVIIIGDSPEIAALTGNITAALREAGWSFNVIGKAVSGPNVSGVLVGTHTDSDDSTVAAAGALISGLQSAGIITTGFTPQFGDELPMAIMGTWDAKNVAPIRLLVSAKP